MDKILKTNKYLTCISALKRKIIDNDFNKYNYTELLSILMKLDYKNIIKLYYKENLSKDTYYISKTELIKVFPVEQMKGL